MLREMSLESVWSVNRGLCRTADWPTSKGYGVDGAGLMEESFAGTSGVVGGSG